MINMFIKSLLLVEDGIECNRTFPNGIVYLHSSNNSMGKTTFLRLLFYSLGYQIPSMRGINFEEIKTVIEFEEKNHSFRAERNNSSFHLIVDNNAEIDYALPAEHLAFLKYVFQEDNGAILSNILGFMYIDQDKGWSLLNRGTVIGRIKFNINELVAALNDVDISDLLEREKRLMQEKEKYETIKNMQNLTDIVFEENGEYVTPDIEKEALNRISYKRIEIQRIKKNLKELNDAISSQESLMNYLENLRLIVKNKDGVEIVVSRNNIIGALPNTELLKARKSILSYEIDKLDREIKEIEAGINDQKRKNESTDLFANSSKHNSMYGELNTFLAANQANISDLIEDAAKELASVRVQISNAVKSNNNYILKIYEKVYEYSKSLNVDDYIIQKEEYIFTKDLKSLSGTILSKIIFAFKLAFLKVIEDKMGTRLLFVIDSPRSKEMDADNYKLIMDLIYKELSSNQVFIATIYDVDYYQKKIEFTGQAIEQSLLVEN